MGDVARGPSIAFEGRQTGRKKGGSGGLRAWPSRLEAWLEAERTQLPLWLPVGVAAWFWLPSPAAWSGFLLAMAALATIGFAFGRGGRGEPSCCSRSRPISSSLATAAISRCAGRTGASRCCASGPETICAPLCPSFQGARGTTRSRSMRCPARAAAPTPVPGHCHAEGGSGGCSPRVALIGSTASRWRGPARPRILSSATATCPTGHPRWLKADASLLAHTGGLAIHLDTPRIATVAGMQTGHPWAFHAPDRADTR